MTLLMTDGDLKKKKKKKKTWKNKKWCLQMLLCLKLRFLHSVDPWDAKQCSPGKNNPENTLRKQITEAKAITREPRTIGRRGRHWLTHVSHEKTVQWDRTHVVQCVVSRCHCRHIRWVESVAYWILCALNVIIRWLLWGWKWYCKYSVTLESPLNQTPILLIWVKIWCTN